MSGLLSEADFQRVYKRIKTDRLMLEEKLKQLEAQKESPAPTEDRAKELVRQYLASAYSSRPARAASDGDSPHNRGRPFSLPCREPECCSAPHPDAHFAVSPVSPCIIGNPPQRH